MPKNRTDFWAFVDSWHMCIFWHMMSSVLHVQRHSLTSSACDCSHDHMLSKKMISVTDSFYPQLRFRCNYQVCFLIVSHCSIDAACVHDLSTQWCSRLWICFCCLQALMQEWHAITLFIVVLFIIFILSFLWLVTVAPLGREWTYI